MRTGIQRISGEICRHAPRESIIPVRLNTDHYTALPPLLIEAIGKYFQDPGDAFVNEIKRIGATSNGAKVRPSASDSVLVPEIFDETRAAFFRAMSPQQAERLRFVVYDLLPFTHPEYFLPDMPLIMYGYYDVIRRLGQCGFISEYTRNVYCSRLKRTSSAEGVILPLGCDSLGHKAQQPNYNRPLTFTVLGTIEPRKNHQ